MLLEVDRTRPSFNFDFCRNSIFVLTHILSQLHLYSPNSTFTSTQSSFEQNYCSNSTFVRTRPLLELHLWSSSALLKLDLYILTASWSAIDHCSTYVRTRRFFGVFLRSNLRVVINPTIAAVRMLPSIKNSAYVINFATKRSASAISNPLFEFYFYRRGNRSVPSHIPPVRLRSSSNILPSSSENFWLPVFWINLGHRID